MQLNAPYFTSFTYRSKPTSPNINVLVFSIIGCILIQGHLNIARVQNCRTSLLNSISFIWDLICSHIFQKCATFQLNVFWWAVGLPLWNYKFPLEWNGMWSFACGASLIQTWTDNSDSSSHPTVTQKNLDWTFLTRHSPSCLEFCFSV